MKVKFCQFKMWILYHNSQSLWGKLFRLGMCLSSTLIFVKLLYQFGCSQLVYLFQPLKASPSSAYHLGRPYKRWAVLPLGEQCSLFVPQWTFHTWVRVIRSFSTRMHTLVCIRFLLGMSVTSLCGPLGSNPAWQWSPKTILILLRIVLFHCTNFWLKAATFKILINDKFPPGGFLLAA